MKDDKQENIKDIKNDSKEIFFEEEFYECLQEDLNAYSRCHHGIGRMRRQNRWPAWMEYAAFEVPDPVNITPEEKLEKMKKRETWLQNELEELRAEIAEFTKEKV
ncbi:MAG: DUF5320 domain-containing protein [Anaerolineae bacterium]|nr:DUF5320 domain-containing protein [Anaerolineae bacterium]